jgi:hypothetical protein
MEENAWVGQALTSTFYLVIGVRMFMLSSQTKQTPERLLSGLFLFSGLSYLGYALAAALQIEALWTPLNFTARVLYAPAPIFLAIFTRQVFRPSGVWATGIVWATAALAVTSIAGSAYTGDWEAFSLSSPWFWCEWTSYTLPFGWAGIEAFAQYLRARRRMQHGLCDPMVCNRFLLWGLYGALSLVVSLLILPMYLHYERHGQFATLWDGLSSAAETLSIAMIWCVFFPPLFYRRWITGTPTEDGATAQT